MQLIALVEAINRFPKDGKWHCTTQEVSTQPMTTYIMWDPAVDDWRFITTHDDGRIQQGYIGINA